MMYYLMPDKIQCYTTWSNQLPHSIATIFPNVITSASPLSTTYSRHKSPLNILPQREINLKSIVPLPYDIKINSAPWKLKSPQNLFDSTDTNPIDVPYNESANFVLIHRKKGQIFNQIACFSGNPSLSIHNSRDMAILLHRKRANKLRGMVVVGVGSIERLWSSSGCSWRILRQVFSSYTKILPSSFCFFGERVDNLWGQWGGTVWEALFPFMRTMKVVFNWTWENFLENFHCAWVSTNKFSCLF